jgi:hypothetical protein
LQVELARATLDAGTMKWATSVCVGAVITTTTLVARAMEDDGTPPGPFGIIHLEAAARFSAAVESPITSPGNRVGGGFGGRAGASYLGFYGGLSFLDLLSEGECLDSFPSACSTTQRLSYGIEGGYGRTLNRILLIRGVLGVGDYVEIVDGTSTSCTGAFPCGMPIVTTSHNTSHNLYLQPGLLVAVALGPVLIGIDANVFYMPAWSPAAYAAFMAGGQLGVRL